MTSPSLTSSSISPDSDDVWTVEGAWSVAEGVHRVPLPLPDDALRAVNVYVVEGDDGLTLIDGGWAIDAGRATLERSLALIGADIGDIKRFLVTHAHRDHYTLAASLAAGLGAELSLGLAERPTLEVLHEPPAVAQASHRRALIAAGAHSLVYHWERLTSEAVDVTHWRFPDRWLDGDTTLRIGNRSLDAIHTPGHTPGHFVFAARVEGLLFAGDHVLPTITPSIGYTSPTPKNPLGDFLRSLAKVRTLPDLLLLPAHGPIWSSTHARVDALLTHHEQRLSASVDALRGGYTTAYEVARALPWTRHQRSFSELDPFSQGLAARETQAHLDVLVARMDAFRDDDADGVARYRAAATA